LRKFKTVLENKRKKNGMKKDKSLNYDKIYKNQFMNERVELVRKTIDSYFR
jgi:hypothetical protein